MWPGTREWQIVMSMIDACYEVRGKREDAIAELGCWCQVPQSSEHGRGECEQEEEWHCPVFPKAKELDGNVIRVEWWSRTGVVPTCSLIDAEMITRTLEDRRHRGGEDRSSASVRLVSQIHPHLACSIIVASHRPPFIGNLAFQDARRPSS